MKAVILGAEYSSGFSISGKEVPKILLPLNQHQSIIDYQIRLLNLCGVPNEEIYVVIGKKGVWENQEYVKAVINKRINIVYNEENTNDNIFGSYQAGLRNIDDDTIIMDGDLILDKEIIELFLSNQENLLFVRNINTFSRKNTYIYTKNDVVIGAITNNDFNELSEFNLNIYAGMMCLSKSIVNEINNDAQVYPSVSKFISKISKNNLIYALNYDTILSSDEITNAKLQGGSYASLHKKNVVRKEAVNEGKKKLENEIMWLNNISDDLTNYFPEILDYAITDEIVWCEMPYYDMPNLRTLLMTGVISNRDAIIILDDIFDVMFNKVYSQGIKKAPMNWTYDKHFNRIYKRNMELMQNNEVFKKIIDMDYLTINGIKYRNIPELVYDIFLRNDFISRINPSTICMIHGDLHFQNLLIDLESQTRPFILADPRGELLGSDLYYDLGKVFHSVNGLYDFIHTDQFKLDYGLNSNSFDITYLNEDVLVEYDKIKNNLDRILMKQKFIKEDKDWKIKALFNEAIHFSTVSCFHLDAMDRALTMYLVGVKLLNEFYNEYVSDYPTQEKMININNQTDYLKAIESKLWRK